MPQIDNFNGVAGDFLIASSINPYAIVPHDTDPLPVVPKAIYIGTGGDVTLRGIGADADVTLKNLVSGQEICIRASHVRATGTTAGDLVALA
ncbi:hypothetical protein [Erythrobacter sp. CCH5-A1]|jgi:hypothetical protein|uniref:spike base protein, RCAP_Rcc01079 family n=1 Tax=Erythrobacter sp. CCH5-A1 TaxID=1768792 RepID=UPI000AE8B79A|nr:hypothetical protein [Erythrobacter sp. CCH5-A1]